MNDRSRHIWFRPPGADLSRCVRCDVPRDPDQLARPCPGHQVAPPAPPPIEARA